MEASHPIPEQLDVLVVGAGLSGIGTAVHLEQRCPDRSFAIAEARSDIGGTWDLFRYPGVRSDSDMHTLGYDFKPWTAEKSIADGPSIMAYLRETVAEHELRSKIHFGHRLTSASWSSEEGCWTARFDTPEGPASCRAGYIFMCSGYYSYAHGHRPHFDGEEAFEGRLVHPQEWPEDLDYANKRVVVIGSGATAITLVPAMAHTAAHVTMLQRSPTWVAARPDRDALANLARRVLGDSTAYRFTRWKNTRLQQMLYRQSRTKPEKLREALLKRLRKELGDDELVERHFHPSYDPWDQRLCLVTNGDLFTAMREGRASVVTDRIARFDATGIVLESGEHLDADIVVTATGLELVSLGEASFDLDGEVIDFSETWTYKGFAYSGVPNLGSVFGYVNASWTLRSDLLGEYLCRMLQHMEATGTRVCTPELREEDRAMAPRPWIDEFNPGYMTRAMHLFPKQGDREPWRNPHDYLHDRKAFLEEPVDDGVMRFSAPTVAATR